MIKKYTRLFYLFIVFSQFYFVAAVADNFNDILFDTQWGLKNSGQIVVRRKGELKREKLKGIKGKDINWVSVKDLASPQSKDVVIAVIDSGIDLSYNSSSNSFEPHDDLDGKLWINKKNCKSDENYLCYGVDFLELTGMVSEDLDFEMAGHGTLISGIIAASHNNIGIAGVLDSHVKIMPLKVAGSRLKGFAYERLHDGKRILFTSIVASAIHYAIDNGADVINISLGWPELLQVGSIKKALDRAFEMNIPIVAAAGNMNKNTPLFPCAYEGVICVGSVDNQGKITEFSDYGGKVDILAPGEQIVSTFPRELESRRLRINGYESKNGNSFAAPFVSAVVGAIKLINPGISLDEIKARLYFSAKHQKLSESNGKFSSNGLVDMKEAITTKPSYYISPLFKDISNVEYDSRNLNFSFKLPIKNYLNRIKNIKVEVSLDSKGASLYNKSFFLEEIKSGEVSQVNVTGYVSDTKMDSSAIVNVKIYVENEFFSQKSTFISFYKTIEEDLKTKSIKTKLIHENKILFLGGTWKVSSLKKVMDKYSISPYLEYFYIDPKKQTPKSTIITLLRIDKKTESFEVSDIEVYGFEEIYAIINADINLDGNFDYIIYGAKEINKKEKKIKLLFTYLDKNFNPLFGNRSNWIFDADLFGGLPIESGKENFSWVKHDSQSFGNILLPSFIKTWSAPEKDNSNDMLDRLPISQYLFFLNPTITENGVEIEKRVLDNYDFITNIRKRFSIKPLDNVSYLHLFNQSREDVKNGKINFIMSVGREYKRNYYNVSFKNTKDWFIEKIDAKNIILKDNISFPVFSLTDNINSLDRSSFLVHFSRNSSRLTTIGKDNIEYDRVNLDNRSWIDPIFTYIASYKDNKTTTTFLETRYNVLAVDSASDKTFSLPIHRDSSFPGLEFSGTMTPIRVRTKASHLPGIYIDSSIILGDRIYTMVKTEDDFIRPISLSTKIPENCVSIEPSELENTYYYTFLCKDENKNLEFKFFPIEL